MTSPSEAPGLLVVTSESSPSPPHYQRKPKPLTGSYLQDRLPRGPPTPQGALSADEDLPFDQKPRRASMGRALPKNDKPFDEPVDEIMALRTPEASPDRLALQEREKQYSGELVSTPKFDPFPSESFDPQPTFQYGNEQRPTYEEFGLSPGSTATGSSKPPQLGDVGDDEDSLFDFEESIKLSKSAARKAAAKRRERRVRQSLPEDDETSLETTQQDTIKERTQMAFKVRRDRSVSMVSFDKEPDMIHAFTKESSVEERSINSIYTKSMESEVEDVIKDLLFIGDQSRSKPGKRRIKDSDRARALALRAAMLGTPSDDESTLNTLDTATADENSTVTKETLPTPESDQKEHEKYTVMKKGRSNPPPKTDDGPISSLYGYIEGGLTTMTEAFGLKNEKQNKNQVRAVFHLHEDGPKEQYQKISPKSSMDEFLSTAIDLFLGPSAPLAPNKAKTNNNTAGESGTNKEMRESKGVTGTKSHHTSVSNVPELKPPPFVEARRKKDTRPSPNAEKNSQSVLQKDPRFAELAVYAALNLHESHKIPFDERARDLVVSAAGFSVVRLGLPLGILFQENGGGCWVAKIFPEGNTAKKAKGKVRVGDQLVAIEGKGAVKLKVDEICSLVSGAKNTDSIELVFLRYTGPLRPSSPPPPTQEGYELQSPSFGKSEKAGRYSYPARKLGPPNGPKLFNQSSSLGTDTGTSGGPMGPSKNSGGKCTRESPNNSGEMKVELDSVNRNGDTGGKAGKKGRFRLFARAKLGRTSSKGSF